MKTEGRGIGKGGQELAREERGTRRYAAMEDVRVVREKEEEASRFSAST